ncbi:hypothetical protein BBO99_00001627 [Phytophthora kernoviae]|uniref:RNA helicase n=1 Tax=Phytophthora kernoviae TaxID=325452 RepID=A0A3R7JAY7_9STRA|nr:hypothetical protein JM18_001544 [Phytophthora kernoviae]RLN45674.1 hypothetical protein BBI17_001397 [Phytophthora kernoviae]RLN83998.1 hypothetical protein BBO99_00001627 [Phytophthora kernoviae]
MQSTKKPRTGLDLGGEDSDEEVYAIAKRIDNADAPDDMAKKVMEVLAPVEHSTVQYEPFRRAFYTPYEDTATLSEQGVKRLRGELSVRVDGADVPAPVRSFMHLGFDKKMLSMIMKLGLEAPTAIQAQAFPVALTGRDLIGIAKTGSGKTLAFTLPMVRHVMDQRELQRGEGPIAVVLAPTRELAHQTYVQAKKFLGVYGASCAAIYGGAGKWDQVQALRKGVEVVVATPGRLIEMIRKKAAPMSRVTFVVLDEADRMFEMGFEAQLRSVLGQIRPDYKTQQERSEALAKFKSGECRILVATDVAARGLDVKDVKNVVNFDVAKNIDIHVHRIGRTGRMGHEGFEPGTAYTLVTRNETQFAAQLVYNMDVSGQPV